MADDKVSRNPGTCQGQAKARDTQKDKVDRPEPSLDAVEGDEETIDESLRQKEGRNE